MTSLEIIQGLVEQLEEREWILTDVRCPRGCCHRWEYQCQSCEQLQEKGHRESCDLSKMLKEGQAYLVAHQPRDPSEEPSTLWDRISDETLSHHTV